MTGAGERAAYLRAYALFEAVQTENADAAVVELHGALDEAERRGWQDVAFVLAAALVVHAVVRAGDGDPGLAVDALVRRAEGLAAPAFVAIALGLRAIVAFGDGVPDRLLDDASTAVALLDDETLPPLDRCTGLVVVAAAFNTLQLWELVDELYTRATALAPSCDAPVQAAAVAMNRVLTNVEWALALLQHGDDEAAGHRLDQAAAAVPAARAQALPPLWRLNLDALADVVSLVRGRGCEHASVVTERHRAALLANGDIEALPLLEAAAALVLWRTGERLQAVEAARRLTVPASASSGARSFPMWVRALVLSGAAPDEGAVAQREYAEMAGRLGWASRLVVLAAARSRIEVERRRHEHEHLARAVHLDALTGLRNRRGFDSWLEAGLAQPGLPTALLLVDLDDFKQINDVFGHDVGDEVLRRIGRIISGAIRAGDQALRQGGDEFAVLLVGEQLSASTALGRAEALRDEVAREPWGEIAAGLAVAVSVGVAFAHTGESAPAVAPVALYRAADAALYRAKRAGVGVDAAPPLA